MDPEKLIETLAALGAGIANIGDKIGGLCDAYEKLSGRIDAVEKKSDAAGSRERVNNEMREDKKRRDNDEDGDDKGGMAERVAADSVGVDRATFSALASSVLTMKKQMDASNRPSSDMNAMADAQAVADSVLRAMGDSAPVPFTHEDVISYKIRCARKMQPSSSKWRSVDLNLLRSDSVALDNVLSEVRADALLAANSPVGMKPGEYREITETMPGGHRSTRFIGTSSIFKEMTRPVRHVAYIGTRRDQTSAH
jgi:hypothetical protein